MIPRARRFHVSLPGFQCETGHRFSWHFFMVLLSLAHELPLGGILMGLFGGLALFLYGLDQMADALKLIAGDRMKTILAKLTTNRFTGALAGR